MSIMTWTSQKIELHKFDSVCCENLITKQKAYGFLVTSWNFRYGNKVEDFGMADAIKIYRGTNRTKIKTGYTEPNLNFVNGRIGKGNDSNTCFYPEFIISENPIVFENPIRNEIKQIIIYSARVVIFEKAVFGL